MRQGTTRLRILGLCAGLFATAGLLQGCNDAQAGSLLGAGIGALAGQAIGGDTEATLIGTAVGAAGGYIIGNESDKRRDGYGRRPQYRGSYGGSYGGYYWYAPRHGHHHQSCHRSHHRSGSTYHD